MLKIRGVPPTLFEDLSALWREDWRARNPRGAILERLREHFKMPRWHSWEEVLLYGQTQSTGRLGTERLVGWLVAVREGVVLLDTGDTPILRPLTGLLVQVGDVYTAKTFSSWSLGASLAINRQGFAENQARWFHGCPASITFDVVERGAAKREPIVEHLGIYPERWQLLDEWLQRWLPDHKEDH